MTNSSSDSAIRSLGTLAAITFLNYAARGLTIPFISLYLVSVGFSGTQLGFALSASAFVRLIVPPLLNSLADRAGKHRRLYYGLVIGNAGATFGLVASVAKLWLSGVVIVRDSLDMSTASLLSQLTITKLKQQGRDIYGRLRAWGSFGWAVTTMVSGQIYNIGGYGALFIVAGLLNLCALPLIGTLPESTMEDDPDDAAETHQGQQRTRYFIILMVAWIVFYVGMSASGGFIFVYFQQELGASNTLIGVLASVAALSEIPSMAIIDRLLRRMNLPITVAIGVAGMASIWVIASFLAGVAWLIPLMIFRGTFYTFQTVGMTLLVSNSSHPQNAATNQAISQVTIPALALLITGPIAGWIFDHYGARILFRLVAVIAVVSVLILVMTRHQYVKKAQLD